MTHKISQVTLTAKYNTDTLPQREAQNYSRNLASAVQVLRSLVDTPS